MSHAIPGCATAPEPSVTQRFASAARSALRAMGRNPCPGRTDSSARDATSSPEWPVNAAASTLRGAAAHLLGLVMGVRSGLFVSPLNTVLGMGFSSLSLALALGQLGIGLAQPIIRPLADRHGAARVIVAGALVLAMTRITPFPGRATA